MKVTSSELFDLEDKTNSGKYAVEYILSQQCLDKSILKSRFNREMGIGCSCAPEEYPGVPRWTCYIGVARSVDARNIVENEPTGFNYGTTHEDCSTKCVTNPDNNLDFNEWFRTQNCPVDQVADADGYCKRCGDISRECHTCQDSEDG